MRRKREGLRAERQASNFIAQRETGPWGEREQCEFEAWLNSATLHRVTYYRLNAVWQEAGRLKAFQPGASPTAPALVPSQSLPQTKHVRTASTQRWGHKGFRRVIAAAVVLTVLSGLAFVGANLFSPNNYRTPVGGLKAIQMPDGTKVTLNTDSLLHIEVNALERHVDLNRGEAYFDVAKDPRRPFVVNVNGQRVVAVGTRFSVRRDANDVHVSVTEGAVRMEPPKHGTTLESPRPVLLHAGAIALASSGSISIQERSVDEVEQRLTWRSGVLTFQHTPLAQAVQEINRYNSRKIVILDPAVGRIQVGGIFVATQLDGFLHLLESGFPVRVITTGERIEIASLRDDER